jgi:chromosome segregation and condensation protein ScpB
MSCGRDHKKVVLDAMKSAGRPVKAGEIAETTGMDKKDVDKAITDLKKEKKCISPKRCFYTAV